MLFAALDESAHGAQSGGHGTSALAPLYIRATSRSRAPRGPSGRPSRRRYRVYSLTHCVCFEAQTEKHLLGLKLTAFDPKQSLARAELPQSSGVLGRSRRLVSIPPNYSG